MAPNPKTAEIIDLTDSPAARVIELNSDGEVVPGASADTAQAQPEQTKRKRKKRKRKSTNGGASAGASEREEGEIGTGTSGADVSRNSPNVDDIELHIEMLADRDGGGGGGGEEVVPAEGSGRKKTLAERLSGSTSGRREDGREEKRERGERDRKRGREGDREREKDRQRDRDRERRRDEDRDRQRERRRSRSRERGGDRSRRRSREREREQRRRDKAPVADAPLFFEDVTPAELPPAVKPQENIAGPSKPRQSEASAGALPEKTEPDLLLPAHVSLAEGAEGDADSGALKVPTPEGSDDEDYIDYLDYDDDRRAPGMVRYWELEKLAASEAKATKPSRTVCKKCGAEGEHKTYECPVLICLTCGARDEHLTRSCPISKTCFTCGMKGHIGKTCPNRAATRAGEYNQYHDCDRCGARTHQTNECPTLWRIYDYVGDDERQEILRVRETKRTLGLGQGGEGYIATDEWCYNCGGCGHLGDDCNDRPKPFDAPSEPSAFSLYNILSGPFSSEATRPSTRAPRDWETADAFADGFGFVAPMDVGKQGRKKERARLERRAREAAAEDDEDDWFGAARSRGRSGGGGGGGGGGSGNGNGNGGKDTRHVRGGGGGGGDGGGGSKANGGGKIRFDFSQASLDRDRDRKESGGRDSKRQRVSYDDLPGPSRETDSIQIRGASRKHDRYGSSASRDRYDRDPPSRGPRYRGGYTR